MAVPTLMTYKTLGPYVETYDPETGIFSSTALTDHMDDVRAEGAKGWHVVQVLGGNGQGNLVILLGKVL